MKICLYVIRPIQDWISRKIVWTDINAVVPYFLLSCVLYCICLNTYCRR